MQLIETRVIIKWSKKEKEQGIFFVSVTEIFEEKKKRKISCYQNFS